MYNKNTPEKKYLQSLLGKVNFVLSLSPDNAEFKEYKAWIIAEMKNI